MSSRRRADIVEGTRNAWTEERWKLIVGARGVEFLYDLERDPFELTDVAAEHPAIVARLRSALDAHVERARARGTSRARDARPASEARVEELRALGYLGGAEDPVETSDGRGGAAGGAGERR